MPPDDVENGDEMIASTPARRAFVRFDPTVSTGTILQLALFMVGGIVAYGTYQSDKATQRMEVEQIKGAAASDKAATKESLADLRADVKDVQRTLVQVNQTLAVIEAKQPPKQVKP